MPVIKDTSRYRDDEDIFETYEKTKFEHRIALNKKEIFVDNQIAYSYCFNDL